VQPPRVELMISTEYRSPFQKTAEGINVHR